MPDKQDTYYTQHDADVGSFKFDKGVAEVFNDMIARSVPGYPQIISLLPTLTRQFCIPEANYYDLGCSTGAGLVAMAAGLADTPATLIGVDTSQAMLSQAEEFTSKLAQQPNLNVQLTHADICSFPMQNAAVTLLNFTLQFIPLAQRSDLIQSVHSSLRSGGVLVLSEKLLPRNNASQDLLTRIHHQYKFDQGYSNLEIAKKRDAIENVLIPETLADHERRLQQAGFNLITPWIRNLQFVSILAVKD